MAEETTTKTAAVRVRLTDAERKEWERHAKREGRTVSNWVRWIVSKITKGDGTHE